MDKLKSSVFDWEKLEVKATKTGARREVVNSPTVTCASFECHATPLNLGEVLRGPLASRPRNLLVKEGLMEV